MSRSSSRSGPFAREACSCCRFGGSGHSNRIGKGSTVKECVDKKSGMEAKISLLC